MCDLSWLGLASISIDEGICGWIWNLLYTDWFAFGLAWNRLDRLGPRIVLVLLKLTE